jgi:RNA-binding protein 26
LKEHFTSYGDLSNVELEDLEASESEGLKNCSACITFAARRSAERAFVNGKCWQGHNLKFMWLTSSNSRSDPGVRENSPSTQKGHSETEAQAAEKFACIVSEDEVSASENGEPQNQIRESCVDHMELGEDSEPDASPTSGEKELPKGDVC